MRAVEAARALIRDGKAVLCTNPPVTSDSLVVSARRVDELVVKATSVLAGYHTRAPLRRGMPREELRSQLKLDPTSFTAVLTLLEERGAIVARGRLVAQPGYEPELTKRQTAEAAAYLASLLGSPYSPPTDGRLDAELMAYLEDSGRIVRMGDVAFATDAYEAMVAKVSARLKREGTITLGQVRDMFGTSRRYAQALLEHLDSRQITRREGDFRVLR